MLFRSLSHSKVSKIFWLTGIDSQLEELILDVYSFCSSFIEADRKESIDMPSVMVQEDAIYSSFEQITEEQMVK